MNYICAKNILISYLKLGYHMYKTESHTIAFKTDAKFLNLYRMVPHFILERSARKFKFLEV